MGRKAQHTGKAKVADPEFTYSHGHNKYISTKREISPEGELRADQTASVQLTIKVPHRGG